MRRRPSATLSPRMGKTLVIAEKPSVGRDYAKALPGTFTDHKDYLESDDYVVSWAVGHLVELAEPEDYDSKYRMLVAQPAADHPRAVQAAADRGPRQVAAGHVVQGLIKREDVDEIINGCDAGREGELIFSYIYELARERQAGQRLWVSSMTRDAIREGFENLRDGEEMAPLEAAARSRCEADWLVGMNATRAATKVGRAGRRRLAGPGADADAGADRPPRPRDRRLRARDLFPGGRPVRARRGPRLRRPLVRGQGGPHRRSASAPRRSPRRPAERRHRRSVKRTERKTRPPLLYDLTSLQRDANSRFGMSAPRTLAAAQRLYEGSTAGAVITYPRTRSQFLPVRPDPDAQGDRPQPGRHPGATGRPPSTSPGWTCCRWRGSSTTPRSTTTTRSSRPASCREGADRRRRPHLRPGRAPLPGRVPPRGQVRGHRDRHRGRRPPLPHQGPAAGRGRLARAGVRRGGQRAAREAASDEDGARAGAAADRRGRDRHLRRGRRCSRSRPSRRGRYSEASLLGDMETAGRRSRTRSCARR